VHAVAYCNDGVVTIPQAEKQKADAINQCQRVITERDEAIEENKFLQDKLKEAETALTEIAQTVSVLQS